MLYVRTDLTNGLDTKHSLISRTLSVLLATLLAIWICACPAFADEDDSSSAGQRYSIGSSVNTGTDNGFRAENEIRDGDPHDGWIIGEFFFTGYSSVDDSGSTPVFTVPEGESVTLWFQLEQNILMLRGDPGYTISEDTNGKDVPLGVEEQNFGKGALIVVSEEEGASGPTTDITTNFLSDYAVQGQPYRVGTYSAGHYDLSLDYELRDDPLVVFGVSVFPDFYNYKIAFSFDVKGSADAQAPVESNVNGTVTPNESIFDDSKEEPAEQPGMFGGLSALQVGIMLASVLVGGYLVIRSQRK